MVEVDHVLLKSGFLVEAHVASGALETRVVGRVIGQSASRGVTFRTYLALEMLDLGIVNA